MDEKRRKRRDITQNLLITLLALSAVFLFFRTQAQNLGEGYSLPFLDGHGAQVDSTLAKPSVGLSAPVRIAVTGSYGRYASVTMTTADEEFDVPGLLLSEMLGSAGSRTSCGQDAFLQMLEGVSVYYDFLNALPLSVLGGQSEAEGQAPVYARSLLAAIDDGRVKLYLWDGESGYHCCDTAVTAKNLEAVVNQYELGNAGFAMDGLQEPGDLDGIAPHSLFLSEEPELAVYSRTIPAYQAENVLDTLLFNPNTKSRYTESNGTEVIVENGRTLRARTDGSIQYQSGGDESLRIEVGESASLQERIAGSGSLLRKLASVGGGEASLYLESVRQTGNVLMLTYGYELNGVPVCFADGGSAATMTLSGNTVTSLSLRFRQYVKTEEPHRILPLAQAAAIARRYEGSELFIGYADDGAGMLVPRWLAE